MSGTELGFGGTIKTPKWINPIEGVITSGYGPRISPISNKEEFHDGIDISAEENTEVKAVLDAVVAKVGYSESFGVYVRLKAANDYEIMYAHLNKAAVKEGDRVKQGEVVALSGNTGRSTGPHLHYSLWRGGELINPSYYVRLDSGR